MTQLTLNRGGFGRQETWARALGPGASRIHVLNGHAREGGVRDPTGTFSVKWMPRGRGVYRTEGVSHRLSPDRVLVLNAGQPYELEFAEGPYSETLCVFFSEDLVRDAWMSLVDPVGEAEVQRAPAFPDLVFAPGGPVAAELAALHAGYGAEDPSVLIGEERLLLLLGRLVARAEAHRLSGDAIPVTKPATRRALLARLVRARDLIDDNPAGAPDLDTLSAEAAMSKFHFLRLFKAAFGATPAAYAQSRRMERAMALLASSSRPLDRIAEDLGYETAASLVRAFRREVGVTPGAWRGEIRNFG